jgi:hypothetical protein
MPWGRVFLLLEQSVVLPPGSVRAESDAEPTMVNYPEPPGQRRES